MYQYEMNMLTEKKMVFCQKNPQTQQPKNQNPKKEKVCTFSGWTSVSESELSIMPRFDPGLSSFLGSVISHLCPSVPQPTLLALAVCAVAR